MLRRGWFMRGGVAILLALALSGCASRDVGLAPPAAMAAADTASAAPPPATGEWKFDKRVDRATGQSVGKAFVRTERVTARAGKLFSKPAFVQLQCFKDKPVVLVLFSQKVGSNRSARLAYRFNDKPPRDTKAHFHRDQMTIEIDDRSAVQQLVAELRDARTLFVSIDSLIIGATRAEFPVQHAEPAIAHGFAACPLPSGPATRTSALATPATRAR
jgi:hypothetical protein